MPFKETLPFKVIQISRQSRFTLKRQPWWWLIQNSHHHPTLNQFSEHHLDQSLNKNPEMGWHPTEGPAGLFLRPHKAKLVINNIGNKTP